jgi:hypothetical protein
MKEFHPWLVRWAFRAGTRDSCRALAALVSPVEHIILLIAHFFTLVVPIARSNLGRQSCWVACLCVSDYNSCTQTIVFPWVPCGPPVYGENCWLIQYAVFLGS